MDIFLATALVGGGWSGSSRSRFTPEERAPGTDWIGGGVDPRAGLDDVKKRKFLTISGIVQTAVSRYTDYAIPAPIRPYNCETFEALISLETVVVKFCLFCFLPTTDN
jgi:hypothetical protein